MSEKTFFPSTKLIQGVVLGVSFPSRKLLSQNLIADNQLPVPVPGPAMAPAPLTGPDRFEANLLMVLSVLVCGCVCSLGLHCVIQCALRCSSRMMISDTDSSPSVSDGGSANSGVKKKALKTFPVVSYSPEKNLTGLDEECVICLLEFEREELLRILPKCNHGFHVRCIDKWLKTHSSCPKCRHSLIETKITGFSQADSGSISSSRASSTPESTPSRAGSATVGIELLQLEGR